MADNKKLWGGRFSGSTNEIVERLNNSLSFDQRLWPYDIAGSIAHATMLGEQGILPKQDSDTIVAGLKQIEQDLAASKIAFDPAAEDVHSALELLLRERIGAVAGKLHTARSRNDQVATDMRLYLRDAIDLIDKQLRSFQSTMIGLAERELGSVSGISSDDREKDRSPLTTHHLPTILPGFTHLQHAQPVLLSHHLLSYVWMFQRDRERLKDARKRVNWLPLGAGALAGTSFPIDRRRVAELLGFDGVCENSMDAVSDRDFIVEFLSAAALIIVHCSRLAEEIILWNSPEFGFVQLDDSVTTGSSIMPQKKNPDVAELARGKTGRIFGNLMAVLTVIKGLPLTYNKDLQEDKEPLFDTADTLSSVLPALDKTMATAQFRRERMARALDRDFSTATDLADALVRRGLPFRDAHEVTGRIVRYCEEQGIGLEDLAAEKLRELAPQIGVADPAVFSIGVSVAARSAEGGTAASAVARQLELAKNAVA